MLLIKQTCLFAVNVPVVKTTVSADKKLTVINKYIKDVNFINYVDSAAALGMLEGDYKRRDINNAIKDRNELLEVRVNKLADMVLVVL